MLQKITYPTRDLALLDPRLRVLCTAFLAECTRQGLSVFVTQTHRSAAYQQALFDQGRTKPGNIVTKARPGNSAHECNDKAGNPAARAFDIAIKRKDGTLNWDATTSKDWAAAGSIGMALGLDWGGSWTSFKDAPHFQLKAWRTLPSL